MSGPGRTASSGPPTVTTYPPLPEDPAALPPLPPAFDAALEPALAALGLTLSKGAGAAIEAHVRLLLAWTASLNLTAIRDPAAIALLHVVDSLTAVPLIERLVAADPVLLDLGSGGGFPGLPLAVALPARRADLLDSVAKKGRFLTVAAAAARAALAAAGERVPDLDVRAARAEALAGDPALRGGWDVVTTRAVGSLAELVELALPLLRPGGHLIAWKRDAGNGTLADELAAARPIARAVGGSAPWVEKAVPASDEHGLAALADHRLVVVRKVRRTPERFPRPPAERHRLLR